MTDASRTIVYFGTSDFAVPPLQALLDDGRFKVLAVVTQPDKPAGRKGELRASPVAKLAAERGLRLLQPPNLKDGPARQEIAALAPDFFVVAAYGKILPQALLSVPRHGAVNLHGSLLPRYRGASPIQAAILAGDGSAGVSLMLMDREMDHGPLYATAETALAGDDTYATLEAKLAKLAAELLVGRLDCIARGACPPKEQEHDRATFTKILDRNDGFVSWAKETAEAVERKIRAFDPWPGAYAVWRRQGRPLRLKLLSARPLAAPAGDEARAPGTVFITENKNPAVITGAGALELLKIQVEGKKPMTGQALLNGYADLSGSVLDSELPE